jgi:serine/threonine protein kinase
MATRKFRKQSIKKNGKNGKKGTKRHRKSRKQRKMIGGYTELGKGAYGMVVTPSFPCPNITPGPLENHQVSKLFKSEEDYVEESEIGMELLTKKLREDYFILPIASCKDGATAAGWLKCHIIYPLGGNDLDKEMTTLAIGANKFLTSKNIKEAISKFTYKSRNILLGLRQLHNAGYFHNDIKGSNCIVSLSDDRRDERYKIIDIGSVQPFVDKAGSPYADMKLGLPNAFRYSPFPTISSFSYFFNINDLDEYHSFILQLPIINASDGKRMSLLDCFAKCVTHHDVIKSQMQHLQGFWDSTTKYKEETLKTIISTSDYDILETADATHINVSYIFSSGEIAFFSVKDLIDMYRQNKVGFASTIFGRRFLKIMYYQYVSQEWKECNINVSKLKESRQDSLKLQDYSMSKYLLKYLYFIRKDENDRRIAHSRYIIDSIFGRLKEFLVTQVTTFNFFNKQVQYTETIKMIDDIYGILRTNELFHTNVDGWIDHMFKEDIYRRYREILGVDLHKLAVKRVGNLLEIQALASKMEFPKNLPLPTTQEQVKKQYKLMALKYHPDKNRGNKAVATATFQEIGAAYTELLAIVGTSGDTIEHDKIKQQLFRRVDLYSFGFMLLTSLYVFLERNKINGENINMIIEYLITITKFLFLSFQRDETGMMALYDKNIEIKGGFLLKPAGNVQLQPLLKHSKSVPNLTSTKYDKQRIIGIKNAKALERAKQTEEFKNKSEEFENELDNIRQLEFLESINLDGIKEDYILNTTVKPVKTDYSDAAKDAAAAAKDAAAAAKDAAAAKVAVAKVDADAAAKKDKEKPFDSVTDKTSSVGISENIIKLIKLEKEAAKAVAEYQKSSLDEMEADLAALITGEPTDTKNENDGVWQKKYLEFLKKMDQRGSLSEDDMAKLKKLDSTVKIGIKMTRSKFQYLKALDDAYYMSLSTDTATDAATATDTATDADTDPDKYELKMEKNKIIEILDSDKLNEIFAGVNQKVSFEGIDTGITWESIDAFINSPEYIEWMKTV